MLKLGTLRWKGRCKRHPRYDPSDGEGAIKGGCERCRQLFEIHVQHKRLVAMIRAFGPARDQKQPAAPVDERQQRLFG
jgi:hypothetical protein